MFPHFLVAIADLTHPLSNNRSSVRIIGCSLYSSIDRLYAQNPVFEIVHDESVKAYLHMYNGNVQQNPLCVESCD